MEKWQEIAISRVKRINFLEQKASILQAFKEICKPLEGIDGIEIGNSCIKINGIVYRLVIESKEIMIIWEIRNPLRNLQAKSSFMINENNFFQYFYDISNRTALKPLLDKDLNYKEILNNLMNYIMTI